MQFATPVGREKREMKCRQIEKYALYNGNPATLKQVCTFSISQPTLYILAPTQDQNTSMAKKKPYSSEC